ncbi:class I SAM-dependent methyltransferase [Pannus brasiliensis CCIBt3594]|uniref:Class I SAM-dependent methyltransferase n=1 Tax=Pannus brasiliensis CCIBt3594 TaxID=1427578 RepID=A0AAW9QU78_9CHRO
MTEQEREREEARRRMAALALESQKKGSNTDWFEEVYARAAGDSDRIPWAKLTAHPMLTDWLTRKAIDGTGKTALVIGCGLGDDAETLAGKGFRVTAFDISPTAIEWCRQRFPDSPVIYLVADLFHLDRSWEKAFDLVFESRTVQALPLDVRDEAIEAIERTVAPAGTLLVITHLRPSENAPEGPPWPLCDRELSRFTELGLQEIERIPFDLREIPQLFLEYRRG